jgi:hypothetical protein
VGIGLRVGVPSLGPHGEVMILNDVSYLVQIGVELATIAVLAGWLVRRHRQRMRQYRPVCDPAKWTGKAIDVTKLKPTVEDLRRDYLATRHARKSVGYRKTLMGLARRAVLQLAYFRRREADEHAATHAR